MLVKTQSIEQFRPSSKNMKYAITVSIKNTHIPRSTSTLPVITGAAPTVKKFKAKPATHIRLANRTPNVNTERFMDLASITSLSTTNIKYINPTNGIHAKNTTGIHKNFATLHTANDPIT